MNRIIGIILVVAVVLSGIYYFAMRKSSENEANQREEQVKEAREYREFMYREDAVLLSTKYAVDEDRIFNFLIELNEMTDGNIDSLFAPFDRNRLVYYSRSYELSPQIIASVLIDYKAMHACQ